MAKEKKEAEEQPKDDLDKIISDMEKTLNCHVSRGSNPELALVRIPTSIAVFDRILGGGFPRGRIHIFSGPFMSGKTFLAQQVIASAQRDNGTCVFLDCERRYDRDWFAKTSVDVDKLIVIRPDFGEQSANAILEAVKNQIDVIVIDSIAALVPAAEVEGTMEDQFMGLQARMLNKLWRKLVTSKKNNSVIIATNQLRSSIGDRFHPGIQENMPGGIGQYYFASSITNVTRKGSLVRKIVKDKEVVEQEDSGSDNKKEGTKIGFIIDCFLKKCNFAPPMESCSIPFNFSTGQLDHLASIVDLAIDLGIITNSGPWYNYKDQKLQGRLGVYNWFNEDAKRLDALRKEIV